MSLATTQSARERQLMLVEDSWPVRLALRGLFKECEGISAIDEFDDAQGAIEAIDAHAPDVMILDLSLRCGNGVEVLKHVRRHGYNTKVFVYSLLAGPDDIWIELGADAVFDKLNGSEPLYDAVCDVLSTP